MRKLNFKLIRKTVEWLHRRKGISSLILPKHTPKENFRYFKMFGAETTHDGEGVGNYNENASVFSIPLHVHGKNLMGGDEFVEIHSSLNLSKTSTISSGLYSTTPLPEHNGTVIIGPNHIRFKENTQYTLALHLKYFTSATKRSIAMRFDYSDGSYDAPVIPSSAREFKMCFTSDVNKNLIAISSHAESASNIRYIIEGFGVFEGAYSEYSDIFESYDGARSELQTNAPLRKIGASCDEIDLINGIVTRKIQTELINEECEISKTENGMFEITLSSPMRPGYRVLSPFENSSLNDEICLYASDNGESILFKAPSEITSVEELKNYLSENPFNIAYVMKDCIYENTDTINLEMFEEELTMEILTEREPSKIVAEYI